MLKCKLALDNQYRISTSVGMTMAGAVMLFIGLMQGKTKAGYSAVLWANGTEILR